MKRCRGGFTLVLAGACLAAGCGSPREEKAAVKTSFFVAFSQCNNAGRTAPRKTIC